ncbi:MAG: OmpH family outer membrane protein [Alphaproteobacteria bacterium]|nr:OmpH family outer membrane protein [Alphaproteobacteria bacterium]
MNMMNVKGRWAHACAAAVLAAGFMMYGSAAALAQGKPAAPAPQGTLAPKILMIDMQAVFGASKVGQDIARQVKAYTDSARKEFQGDNDALKREGQTLQQQLAILAPSVKDQKIKAFEAKQAAFQRKVQQRQDMIQGGVLQARQQVEKALTPILQGIMAERGANILLDRRVVLLGPNDIDVSQVAVDRLNKKMPSVKVNLVALPQGAQQQEQ